MISEKKFNLEVNNRENIIKQLRSDRNSILVKYQKLNADFLELFKTIENDCKEVKNEKLLNQLEGLKEKFKNHFI